MLPSRLAECLAVIAADNRSGAMAMARRAAQMIAESAPALNTPEVVLEAARAVEAAQPPMAPFANLAERLRRAASEPAGLSQSIARLFGELLEEMERSLDAISGQALALLEDAPAVFTHSSSETVRAALLAAHRAGRLGRVIVTESRPVCEGTDLARTLAAEGIAVDLIIDAASGRVLPEADLVLVGADSLSPAGLVNKAGTYLLALAARENRIPIYALCSRLKILAAPLPEDPPKPGDEIARIPGCRARNYYFDTTPVHLLAGVVTEEGITTYLGR